MMSPFDPAVRVVRMLPSASDSASIGQQGRGRSEFYRHGVCAVVSGSGACGLLLNFQGSHRKLCPIT